MSRRDDERLADVLASAEAIRGHLERGDFDTAHSIVQATVEEDLPPLVAAAARLLTQLESDAGSSD